MSLIKKSIIIDNGSYLTKNGFSGESKPKSIFKTVIGYPKNFKQPVRIEDDITYHVGNEAIKQHEKLKLIPPIEYRLINNWPALERIWKYTLYEDLKVDPKENPVLLTQSPLNFRANREKMQEIMFETFEVPSLLILDQSRLSLFASGRRTGLVVDLGYQTTYIVPLYEGYPLSHAIRRMDIGGKHITDYLIQLLQKKDVSIETFADKKAANEIKERFCFVAFDLDEELKKSDKNLKSFTLPGGETVKIGAEQFLAPEILFNPSKIGMKLDPINMVITDSIFNCDIDLRQDLYDNIILSGGSSLFPGLKERLLIELHQQMIKNFDIHISASTNRENLPWIGGSIISSHEQYSKLWTTIKEYKEVGPYRKPTSF